MATAMCSSPVTAAAGPLLSGDTSPTEKIPSTDSLPIIPETEASPPGASATEAATEEKIPLEETPPTNQPTETSPPPAQPNAPEDKDSDSDTDPISPTTEKAVRELHEEVKLWLKGRGRNELEDNHMIGVAHSVMRRSEKNSPMAWRRKQTKLFSYMLSSYFRLMEDRVTLLEKKGTIGGDEEEESAKAKEKEGEDAKAPEATIPRLNRVPWAEFKRKFDAKTKPRQVNAIDVLTGDPVIPHDIWRDRELRKNPMHLGQLRRLRYFENFFSFQDQLDDPLVHVEEDNRKTSYLYNISQIPEDHYPSIPDRIRINGVPLQQLLEKVLEVSITEAGAPIVIVKPYKLLVQHENSIRGLHTQLRKKFGPIAVGEGYSNGQGSDPGDDSQVSEQNSAEGPLLEEEGKNLLDEYGTEQAYKELSCLVEFMDNDLKALKQFKNASIQGIYFSDLWHIFKPGDEVITCQEPLNAYRVLHVTAGRPYLSPPEDEEKEGDNADSSYRVPPKSSDFEVICYQIDFDGHKFGPVTQTFTIDDFVGRRGVTSLPIYPLRFAQDPKIRDTLLSNGKKFLDLSRGGHIQYRGPNLHEVEEIDSQVIVDFKTAIWDDQDKDKSWKYKVEFGVIPPQSANPAEVTMVSAGGCTTANCCENDYILDDIDLDHRRMEDFLSRNPFLTTDVRYLSDGPDNISHEDLILFPNRLFAFVLKDRKWAVIDVNYLSADDQHVKPQDSGWKSLVLPSGHKEMVYSLVQAHFRSRNEGTVDRSSQTDLIRGKGKGLIILLHGAPGVGKTSTAECVAEMCNRPLYPITCGDLGITAGEVESRLKHIFIQAQKWKCVLLLDEADVFLSQRENNVKHNSLVSVFLRVLEYYQGILFLTTNRVGKMDEAFRSRVHISLYYPPLTKSSMLKIFAENLKLTQKRTDTIRVKRKEIEQFASDHYKFVEPKSRWNGRQIRNAFHIAIAIAENKAIERNERAVAKGEPRAYVPVLRAEHFELVEAASTKFDDYLHSVLGMTQSDLARQKSTRKDDWKSEEKAGNVERRRPVRRADTEDEDEESSFTGGSGGVSEESSERSEESEADEDEVSSEEEPVERQRRRHSRKPETRSSKKGSGYDAPEPQKDRRSSKRTRR